MRSLIIIVFCLLSGCGRSSKPEHLFWIDSEVTIQTDGSCLVRQTITQTMFSPGGVGDAPNDPDVQLSAARTVSWFRHCQKAQVHELTKYGSGFRIVVSGSFPNLASLVPYSREIFAYVPKGIEMCQDDSGRLRLTVPGQEKSPQEDTSSGEGHFKFHLTLRVPGSIEQTTLQRQNDGALTWNIDSADTKTRQSVLQGWSVVSLVPQRLLPTTPLRNQKNIESDDEFPFQDISATQAVMGWKAKITGSRLVREYPVNGEPRPDFPTVSKDSWGNTATGAYIFFSIMCPKDRNILHSKIPALLNRTRAKYQGTDLRIVDASFDTSDPAGVVVAGSLRLEGFPETRRLDEIAISFEVLTSAGFVSKEISLAEGPRTLPLDELIPNADIRIANVRHEGAWTSIRGYLHGPKEIRELILESGQKNMHFSPKISFQESEFLPYQEAWWREQSFATTSFGESAEKGLPTLLVHRPRDLRRERVEIILQDVLVP